ncbi:helix-turn-helix transcriptional regulator [Virgibacillus sp. L01]|uniref:helix-turn-helix transcriptional regulator n=1 Tax=Virgibacillus sp. L01 TaxID=3457429 RepID=UPI003FD24453
MKAERLIKILIVLQHGETTSTKTLANELEVSERTIHRDMESLSVAGIPVFSERGKAGGWRLIDEWKNKLSWLTEKEIISLFLPASEKVLSDLNLNISTEEMKQKLLLSVPNHVRQNATNLWERIYIDTDTWHGSQQSIGSMKSIQQAVMENKKVTMEYKKADNEMKTYMINPLGLVLKGSTWYVIAINSQNSYRNFRLSRIINFTVSEESFTRPSGFILSQYWKESKKAFIQNLPAYEVEVEVSRQIINRIMFTGRFVRHLHESTKQPNSEWVQLSLEFPTEEEAVNFILGFGNQIRVNSPVHIQNILAKKANEILELYRK